MPIRIKAAHSARELRDVFRLRHEVYVVEEGYFKDVEGDVIVDMFDAVPQVVNLIAYDDKTGDTVGTFRVNCESGVRLPSDELYDFGDYRKRIEDERTEKGLSAPVFASAGMLAISKPWRNRRSVFRSLLKMACAVSKFWGVTNIVATVNVKTAKIYQSLGWEFLAEPIWVASINEHIVPVCIESDVIYKWAYGDVSAHHELINRFSDCFEWLLIDSQASVFSEGDQGDEAFLVASGMVKITQSGDEENGELNWTTLSPGAVFGEMTLIDGLPRSGSAIAMANTELIVIKQHDYWDRLDSDPTFLRAVLSSLSIRLREASQRAVIYAHGDVDSRLQYCLDCLRSDAVASRKKPECFVSKTTLGEFAFMANVTEEVAESFLRRHEGEGQLELHRSGIRFFKETKS